MGNEKSERIQLYRAVLANCKIMHPDGSLPNMPYFLQNPKNLEVSKELHQILYDSDQKHKLFAQNVSQFILEKQREKSTSHLRRATILQIRSEIIRALGKLKTLEDSSSSAIWNIKTLKIRKDLDINFLLTYSNQMSILKEGNVIDMQIDLFEKGKINIFSDEMTIGKIQINYKDVFGNLHILKALEKNEHRLLVAQSTENYTIEAEVLIKISNRDKEKLLNEELVKCDEKLKLEELKYEIYFEDLLRALKIEYTDGKFKSIFPEIHKDLEFCESCIIY
ncbi:unnamed protein product [Blepharisma stoltei]|uniref:Uncharacterized protein n=1 Tax=Blepharisma stoltei TaxID=1481888 RepID=A0AAU9INA8_9CILI|nr:unnamed protein product [Blepharisma stoltei]